MLEGAPLFPTVLLVGGPVLLLALGATIPGDLAAPTDVEFPELKEHRTGGFSHSELGHRGQVSIGDLSPGGWKAPRQMSGRTWGVEWPSMLTAAHTCFSIIVQGG